MKKIFFSLIFSLVLACGYSQSTITQTATIPFGNTDNWQNNWVLRRILDALLTPGTPTGTTSFKDNSADTLNARLLRLIGLLTNPNAGANSPWLKDIYGKLNTGTLTVTPAVSALTVSSSSATTSGTVASGQRAVSFTTSSDFVGTINGVARTASTVYSFSCSASSTLPAIAYVITSGSIIIDKL